MVFKSVCWFFVVLMIRILIILFVIYLYNIPFMYHLLVVVIFNKSYSSGKFFLSFYRCHLQSQHILLPLLFLALVHLIYLIFLSVLALLFSCCLIFFLSSSLNC